MKILHLPTATGGHPSGLSQAERSLGYNSEVLIVGKNPFNYQADLVIDSTLFTNQKYINRFFLEIKKIICFFSIRKKYDVFHFNFGHSLLSYPIAQLHLLDLPYYSKKAKIVVTYNGCDARQKYATLKRTNYSACSNSKCYNGVCNNIKVEESRANKIKIFDQYADSIFSVNPDLFYFLPERTKFIPYVISRWYEIEAQPYSLKTNKKIKVVHAPTNRECKGSEHIISAFKILNKKYSAVVEFVLVENLKHHEALAAFQQADLVIDQLLIGYYGCFTVEVMKMGKPVMVYISETDLKFLPLQMQRDCLDSVININAYNIINKLASILENPQILIEYAQKSRAYVEKWHNPKTIAEQIITEYSR